MLTFVACGTLSAAEGFLRVTMRDMVLGLLDLPGSRYSCVAERESGRILIQFGTAAVDPAVVLRWGMEATTALGTAGDGGLEDFILTSGGHYHLVRPLGWARSLLVYLCVDRARVNLASARRELAAARPDELAPTRPPPTPRNRASTCGFAHSGHAAGGEPARPATARGPPTGRRGRSAATAQRARRPFPLRRPRRRGRRSSSDPVLAQPWADDIATMNRLLTALRALSNDAEFDLRIVEQK